MSKIPDFDQIAREVARGLVVLNVVADQDRAREAFIKDLADQFRQIWNASGALLASARQGQQELGQALKTIAEHDGNRGNWTDEDVFVDKPTPQELAQEALRALLPGAGGQR